MAYKNKEDQAKAQARYRVKFLKIRDKALEVGCMDCGEMDPIVLEFHHQDPSKKLFNIGRGGGRSSPQLIAEIAKCDVVCCNCHARRDYALKHGELGDSSGSVRL